MNRRLKQYEHNPFGGRVAVMEDAPPPEDPPRPPQLPPDTEPDPPPPAD